MNPYIMFFSGSNRVAISYSQGVFYYLQIVPCLYCPKKNYNSIGDNNITVVKLFNFRAPLTLLLQRTFPVTTCTFLSALKHLSF